MKNIGLATVYSKKNYGTILQAYATQKILDELGYSNFTIDMRGIDSSIKKKKTKYYLSHLFDISLVSSKVGFVIKKILVKVNYKHLRENERIREKYFDYFINEYIRFSPAYSNINDLKDYVAQNYYAVMVGSDQIWLPQHIVAGYYTLQWVPAGVKKVSLSSSFGKSKLSKDIIPLAYEYLTKLDYISVREKAGADIIEKLTQKNVKVLCDPTMMISRNDWEKLLPQDSKYEDKYILCYFLGKNKFHRQIAKRLREQTGYKIVALTHMDEYIASDEKYADETPYNVGPIEFLNLVRNAEYILSDSFHASVFSIIFEKRFWVFNRFKSNSKMSTNDRIATLLDRIQMKHRLISSDVRVNLLEEIDYTDVEKKIEALKKEACSYIYASLGKPEPARNVAEFIKHECVGCAICSKKCPVKCIDMVKDSEGFLYPVVNNSRCTGCGVCMNNCPTVKKTHSESFGQKAYLVQNLDNIVRGESTSGGVFSALADDIIQKGGVVFGAAFEGGYHVAHKGTDESSVIKEFRGSKYVQSDNKNCFEEVKGYLQEGKYVLYSGTPCQIEGLLSFLGSRYEKLILVDVVCRGTSSPMIWEKYVHEYEQEFGKPIIAASFRDKRFYGYTYTQMSLDTDTNTYCLGGVDNNVYLRSFFENVNVRPSCFACKFRSRYRKSDITLWDCLDATEFTKEMDRLGTTRVLIHTPKGMDCLSSISNHLKIVEVDVNKATQSVMEMKKSKMISPHRSSFYIAVNENISNNIRDILNHYFKSGVFKIMEHQVRIIGAKTGLYSIIKKFAKNIGRNRT